MKRCLPAIRLVCFFSFFAHGFSASEFNAFYGSMSCWHTIVCCFFFCIGLFQRNKPPPRMVYVLKKLWFTTCLDFSRFWLCLICQFHALNKWRKHDADGHVRGIPIIILWHIIHMYIYIYIYIYVDPFISHPHHMVKTNNIQTNAEKLKSWNLYQLWGKRHGTSWKHICSIFLVTT